MNNCQLPIILALFLVISLAANALLYRDFSNQVGHRFDTIEKTLKSHDGRRNAQYGVLKNVVGARCG